jgi:putative ABC transport system permease protein
VLNETAARQLGLPQPWVGQRFGFQGEEGQVIGIVKDFHFLPLRDNISPLVINYYPNSWSSFFIKTQPGRAKEAVAAAERIWKEALPAHIFAYSFLEDDFDRMYRSEQQAGLLFNCFAGIAIFISCLGLFGLAVFVAAQRTREIGIRKVLGASVASVVALLSADFLKLVLVAIVIASPLAAYLMHQWLQDFAYRIEIQWWMFAAAGLMAVAIAFLTVSTQSIRAAVANPVKSLRSE